MSPQRRLVSLLTAAAWAYGAARMEMIFLHGPAASGKLTTARALSESTGFAVFHNHLVVDALLALFPFGSDEFVRLRDHYWLSAFEAAASASRSFIFTFAPEPTVATDFPDRARRAITERGGDVHFVALEVSPAVQDLRVENPDRRQFNKLSSLDTLRRLRASEKGARPIMPMGLTINTDNSPPEATAKAIESAFHLHAVEPHSYY